jgi:hypothetical protein
MMSAVGWCGAIDMDSRNGRATLRPLPVSTFGDIAELGHELHVWCQRCKTSRRIDITPALWARQFAGARFRCERILWDGSTCGGSGVPSMRPPVRAAVDAKYVNLHCEGCVPPWSILEVDHKSTPWSLSAGDRFTCPACGSLVDMRVHGPPWKPSDASRA